MPEVTGAAGAEVELAGEGDVRELVAADGSREPIDVVFPVLHGPHGRGRRGPGHAGARRGAVRGRRGPGQRRGDGQGRAEGAVRQRPACRWCRTRSCASRDGARTRRAWRRARETLGYPLFSKPADPGFERRRGEGARRRRSWPPGSRRRSAYARKAVIERAVPSPREVECAVLGNDDPVASVVGEIVPDRPRVLRLRGEVPRRATAPSCGSPPTSSRRSPSGSSGWRSPRSARSTAPAWRASTSSWRARRGRRRDPVAERDQHDPRVHVDLDVPEALGGERAGLPRPDRAAAGSGRRAARGRPRRGRPRRRSSAADAR